MRILIVGAGMAGMTLAALLEQRGVHPVVVERAASTAHAGYMLGLWPLGSRVLHGLGLYDTFVARSIPVNHYVARDDAGQTIAEWSMAGLAERHGDLLSSTRPDLVDVLRGSLSRADVRFETTVTELEQQGQEVLATFTDGSEGRFDLVVGADGMGSWVRQHVFGEQPGFDTGWGGWVWWSKDVELPHETFVEYWGAGRMLGAYPTRRGVGVFAGAPVEGGFEQEEGRRQRLSSRFGGLGDTVDAMLAELPDDDERLFFWHLSDVRCEAWVRGRVVLLGDASTGFLPTAGIGASMAMESAAVLADELSRTDARFLDHALKLYVQRRKRRVESIQTDSRRLARLMFVRSDTLAWLRNVATRFVSVESAMSNITQAFEEPI